MVRELKTLCFWRAVLAEMLGTAAMVFLGVLAAIGNPNASYPDQEVKVALTYGLAMAVLTRSLNHVSGGHLNPAITLGLLVSCQVSVFRALVYAVAQLLGAALASAIVLGVKPAVIESVGLNQLNGIKAGQGFVIEFLLTLPLVLCVLATTDKRRGDASGSAGFAIGLALSVGHLAGFSFTGCGMNPARSFGPALVSQTFENHWVFWAGPLCASIVAALLYELLCPRGSDIAGRLKVLCHGSESESETEPLLEAEAGAQSEEKQQQQQQ